jgi:hypothetical protein
MNNNLKAYICGVVTGLDPVGTALGHMKVGESAGHFADAFYSSPEYLEHWEKSRDYALLRMVYNRLQKKRAKICEQDRPTIDSAIAYHERVLSEEPVIVPQKKTVAEQVCKGLGDATGLCAFGALVAFAGPIFLPLAYVGAGIPIMDFAVRHQNADFRIDMYTSALPSNFI